MQRLENIKNAIRDVPDFPKEGILFKDITTVLREPQLFKDTIDLMAELVKDTKIDFVAGIEARGFIFGAAIARKLNCGFIPIRKPGKLPYKTFKEDYDLEYGTDSIEVHQDAFHKDASVYLVDDLLATGGTAHAAARLIGKCGAKLTLIGFLIELSFLNGAEKLTDYPVKSLVKF